uniref:Uncharacterized protein n=1 Tax=Neobodo designis TaxID=312471 RepID=A0A7S1LPG2_NEODS|mmetsp:Transcript_25879/g.79910  ORF Transcript_25879/g.79910 Transcript_25879/m.79910 type:complete len:491 (+) Transcript_25879:46-1518(+)|eukprot:CAMPEP_0174838512 /NCGR_PEP_ID=MMETSP1114-20130205/7443_1 /TAXON_ID=312471 /ORGANISM="Neobodo designis, Strain CCAP 1951/1" /LENGTH=490 /DNA_ID=CAMNT_0016072611 /DNA_START=46 /DNA_END=1518 /DNA_ORIENTATION=+
MADQAPAQDPAPPMPAQEEPAQPATEAAAPPPQKPAAPAQDQPAEQPAQPTASEKSHLVEEGGDRQEAAVVVPTYGSDADAINADDTPTSPGGDKHAQLVDKLGHVFLYVSIPISVIAGGLAIGLYTTHEVEAVTVSHTIAGMCAFTSLVLTSIQIFMHLSVYTSPSQQRYIIRIILMCPIYAIDSFVGLMAYRYATVVNLIRDSYESYVIYMFFRLLMDYLGGEEATLKAWAETKPDMPHLFPLCCLPHVKLNRQTLNIWKFCLLQYMIINPIVTLVSIPLIFTDRYDEGDLNPGSAYAWFTALEFVSVTFAFTSLVYFFFASKHLLMDHNPLPKFAAIKTVVFLSFWQTVLLAGLNHFKVIPHSKNWTSSQVATGLGNFILCVEMYLITIAHRWIFTDKPYHPESGRSFLTWAAVKHAFAVTDVITDTTQTAQLLASPLTGGSASREGNFDETASSVRMEDSREHSPKAEPSTTAVVDDDADRRALRE